MQRDTRANAIIKFPKLAEEGQLPPAPVVPGPLEWRIAKKDKQSRDWDDRERGNIAVTAGFRQDR